MYQVFVLWQVFFIAGMCAHVLWSDQSTNAKCGKSCIIINYIFIVSLVIFKFVVLIKISHQETGFLFFKRHVNLIFISELVSACSFSHINYYDVCRLMANNRMKVAYIIFKGLNYLIQLLLISFLLPWNTFVSTLGTFSIKNSFRKQFRKMLN